MKDEIKISKYFQNDFSLFIMMIEFFLVLILGFVGIIIGDYYNFWLGVLVGGLLAGIVAANAGTRYLEY